MDVLDILFPKRCVGCRNIGSFLCPTCFSYLAFQQEDNCLECNRPAIDGRTHPGCLKRYSIDGVSASLVYNPTVKKLISAFKYKPYLSSLQTTLGDLFYEGLIQKQACTTFFSKDCIIVPIPVHPKKLQQRGYNHAELLADALGRQLGMNVCKSLCRIKNTGSQFALKREERIANIKNAFSLKEGFGAKTKYANIVLIDDLVTSGATMLEAAHVLKRYGASHVWGVALAHGLS